MRLDGSTGLTGIIGQPVAHTLSPVLQNTAFDFLGLNWVYLAFEVSPEHLSQAVLGLSACGCRGLNVTMPHKREVLPLLDELSDTARLVGAANTIEFRNGRMVGHNTDGPGFMKSLEADAGFRPEGKSALVLGAGGAARSLVAALAGGGARSIKILNRDASKAEILVGLMAARFQHCSFAVERQFELDLSEFDLVVNATSVGMENNPGLPVPVSTLRPGQIVYDIVYWPLQTELLRAAKARGATIVNGLQMLLHQGAESFSIWTGKAAPIKEMAAALLERAEKGLI